MYALAYSWSDPARDEGGWLSPDDRDYRLGWVEACGRALEQANAHRRDTATLTVDAAVTPCQLGCMEDDGTPIVPGECGEPAERRFAVTLADVDGFRQTWTVV